MNNHADLVSSALPVPGTTVISSHAYGMWVWARQARLTCRLPDGKEVVYFLKVPVMLLQTWALTHIHRSQLAKVTA